MHLDPGLACYVLHIGSSRCSSKELGQFRPCGLRVLMNFECLNTIAMQSFVRQHQPQHLRAGQPSQFPRPGGTCCTPLTGILSDSASRQINSPSRPRLERQPGTEEHWQRFGHNNDCPPLYSGVPVSTPMKFSVVRQLSASLQSIAFPNGALMRPRPPLHRGYSLPHFACPPQSTAAAERYPPGNSRL